MKHKVKELWRRVVAFARELYRGQPTFEDIVRPLTEMRERLADFAVDEAERAADARREAHALLERAKARDEAVVKAELAQSRIRALLED